MKRKQAFVVAGTNSGCGKTTVTIGLMALLKSKGFRLASFKAGPDYIDPLFHQKVTGSPSYNLDSYIIDTVALKNRFAVHSEDADVAVVEGVMGLYDGMGQESAGSAAELSTLLGLPVVLVVNCKAMYQSVAALVSGFANYDPQVKVEGVILNHISGAAHFSFLKGLIESTSDVKVVGYLPSTNDLNLESRHLGLVQAEEVDGFDAKIEKLVSVMEETIDLSVLDKVSAYEMQQFSSFKGQFMSLVGLNIAVASDKAFRFYYHDNLELLEKQGAKLLYFSPLADQHLPANCNAVYLGGGYPEVFAGDLSANQSLLSDLRNKAENGLPVYAECGGLMYLCSAIKQLDGETNAMSGVFNCTTKMTSKLKRFGYALLEFEGEQCRCHEFHHSEIEEAGTNNFEYVYRLKKPNYNKEWICGLRRKNVVAGYAHVHFYSEPAFTNKIFSLWKAEL